MGKKDSKRSEEQSGSELGCVGSTVEGWRVRMGREVWGWCIRSLVRFHPIKSGSGFALLLLLILDEHL